jgi:hypothetical protein
MSKKNGKHGPEIAENIVLRMEIDALRDQIKLAENAMAALNREAVMSTQCIATLMHFYGLDSVELTNADKRAAYEATWFRVRRDIIKFPVGAPSIRLTLLPVTDEERATNTANLAKQEAAKKPRVIEP